MAIFGNDWKDYKDSGPEPNEALKSAKEKYDKQVSPHVSDDFQIGPDGAYEHNSDWDATLMDDLSMKVGMKSTMTTQVNQTYMNSLNG